MKAVCPPNIPNERAAYLLKVLIEHHIRDGQPVGSRTLSRDSRLDLSPATIRNVMSDLEMMGLIAAPHTSAGRIPTPLGYRMFVDSLIRLQPPSAKRVSEIELEMAADFDDTDATLAKSINAARSIDENGRCRCCAEIRARCTAANRVSAIV